MILISDKSLSQEELSRFDIMIDSLYKSIGIKIEIYNRLLMIMIMIYLLEESMKVLEI